MIRLGLRLALAGGREAIVRLAIIMVAVAIGTGLLLSTLAGLNAVQNQNERYAWLNTGAAKTDVVGTADPAWWLLGGDYFHGDRIARIDVAATGPDAPVPPGIPRLPGPGEYYVSPALARELKATPADQLADRFPGRQIGTIADAGLPGPDILLALVGDTPQHLSRLPYAKQVTRIESVDPSDCSGCQVGTDADGMALVLSVVAAALIFPLLMFIGTATRLSAARREQRFAAMRLIGATPPQVSRIATVEATLATVVGLLAGFGVFFALRPAMATITFTETAFFTGDLSLSLRDVLAVAIGIPLAAAVAARVALRRVQISPLGVTRRVTPKPPGIWRLTPAALGVAELAYFVGRRPETTNGQIAAYLTGIFTVMIGMVVAGPWLTMVGARLLAGRARRPAALIAGRRLADNPQAGFRAVSGLMLALFVTAVASGVITTIVDNRGTPIDPGSAANVALVQNFWPNMGQKVTLPTDPAAIPPALSSAPGVRGVLVTHLNPRFRTDIPSDVLPGVIACSELASRPVLGQCQPGAQVAAVTQDLQADLFDRTKAKVLVWPADPLSPAELAAQPMLSIVVQTDGSAATIEHARTVLENAYPGSDLPATNGEHQGDFGRQLVQWQQLANVIILTSLPIAGCSLAVSVAGGLTERKRPFSMLRLTGARLATLRQVVALESAVPLLLVAVLATGMGFLTAHLFLRAQLDYSLHSPGPAYYLLVIGGLVASLGIIASTLPLLRRITGPETARNE
ncbi:FtsX-like permease family protein [Actinoplanes sp. NPDC051513]|uniref:FtsX-like permease family protein n=1 Tax=Actinoplanes sp. NPDC051513 TaxID=3363908 RepID=UPI00379C0F89